MECANTLRKGGALRSISEQNAKKRTKAGVGLALYDEDSPPLPRKAAPFMDRFRSDLSRLGRYS